jgi:hypothetical protein
LGFWGFYYLAGYWALRASIYNKLFFITKISVHQDGQHLDFEVQNSSEIKHITVVLYYKRELMFLKLSLENKMSKSLNSLALKKFLTKKLEKTTKC